MIKLVGELEVTNNPTMLENVLKKLVNMRACMMIVDIYIYRDQQNIKWPLSQIFIIVANTKRNFGKDYKLVLCIHLSLVPSLCVFNNLTAYYMVSFQLLSTA